MLAGKRVIMSFEKFRENLKIIDENYPSYDNGLKVSLRDIRSGDLIIHTDFLIQWCGSYNITPEIISEEWQRVLKDAHA